MDLKNFITESLYQIVGGIKDAQKKIAASNYEKASDFQLKMSEKSNRHNVYFDIALTVVGDQSEESSPATLRVMGLSNISTEGEQPMPIVSRIRFSVSLIYTQASFDKNPFLSLSSH